MRLQRHPVGRLRPHFGPNRGRGGILMASSARKPKSSRPSAPSGGLALTQRVDRLNKWREQYNPLRGLTLSRAVTLAESYFRGEMADYQWACFFVEQTDPDLFALLEMRLGRILEMEYDFVAEKGADEKAAEKQKERLTGKIALIDNLDEAIEHLALAPFRHYAHLEKWYEGGEIIHLEPVDQWNVVRDGLRGPWRYNPEARSCSYASLTAAADMPPERFLFREVRRAINRIALFKFVRANLSEKDWDAFVEIYGIPGGVLIGPPDVSEEQKSEFETAANRIAEGGTGYAPHGSDWKPNTSARGTQPFKERLDHLSEKLILVGTGGKLTMLNGPSGLGGGQAETHREVFDQIAAAEARRIAEVFNAQLVPELLGGEKPLVYFRLAAHAEADTGAAVEEVQKLAQAGYHCDPDEVAERTGWSVTLKPPVPAPFAGVLPNRARLVNREQPPADRAREAAFKAESLARLSSAQRAALSPLVAEIERIAALPDEQFDAGLRALQARLPELYRTVLSDAALAEAWEDIYGAALVEGAAAAARAKSTTTSRP